MKAKNERKRLASRIAGWDAIRGDAGSNDKKKMVNKQQYTRPGSFKK